MAAPSPGNCLILFFLVLILYTGFAFRIRDVPSSANSERPTSCPGHVKCPVDKPATDSSPTDSAGTRSPHVEATRGRINNKITTRHPPPVIHDDLSTEILHDDRAKGKAPLSSSSGKFDKWTGSQGKTVRFGRTPAKVDHDDDDNDNDVSDRNQDDEENDDVEDIDVEDDDDDDDDDDSVDRTNDNGDSEEDSTEVIDADADDDDDEDDDGEDNDGEDDNDDDEDEDDDDDDDDDENDSDGDQKETEDLSENVDDEDAGSEDDKSDIDINDDVDDMDDDENDVKIEKPEGKVFGKSIQTSKNQFSDNAKVSTTKDSPKNIEYSKTTNEKKISFKAVDNSDEIPENKDDRSVSHKQVVKDSTGVKKVHSELKKKIVKQESDEDDDEHDDNDSNGDVDKEVKKVSSTPVPMRKLEKVRLADKEKSKLMDTPKPVETEQGKSVKVKVSATSVDETSTKKKKDAEVATAKPETEKSQAATPTKPETKVKADVSLKTSKIAPSNVKSETSKKSKTTTTTTTMKEEVITKNGKNDKANVVKKSEKSSATKVDADRRLDRKSSNAKKPVDVPISLTQLNNAILQVPTFVPNFTAVEDPACQQHGKIFLRQLRGYKLWALQMLDSSAKIPSGLLRGNVNQLGDFDQCLGVTARVKVDEKTVKVQGKYCLASLDLHALIPDMKVPVNFMQSRGFIRASTRDSGHFIPRFTTANWALCIPAACSAKDAQIAIESALSHINSTTGLKFSIDVDPDMCYVRQKYETYTKETIGVLYFYAMIICVVLVATIRDYIVCPQGKGSYSERIIMSFSLRRTWKILTKIESNDGGEISCIHGIRSLATIALYVAHKMIPTSQIPYANRIFLTEIANNPASSLLRTSLAYTDCFLLLSGLLTAFNMARESAKKGEIRWFCRLVGRFIRLTPSLLVVVFWYAYVMDHTGTGPQWHRVIGTNAELCKQNSWTNFLYIQNFFPFEEMCATHTHQLALDMQLSLIAPMLVFFLTLKPVIGILVIFFILQVSATVRYFATTSNNLSLVIYHGMTMKQLYKTANLTYALPLHRATPYVFGAGLGVLLHYTGKNVRIYRIFVILGWIIAMVLGAWTLFSPWHMARRDYVYDVEEAAHYAVIAPVAWSIALCWTIFACFTEHGGIINKFLSSFWMILFSRISYAVYLCQFAIFFYNVGTTRYSSDVQFHRFIDPYEAMSVALVSVVLTLLIDIPMQEVKNVMMESTDRLGAPIGVETLEDEEKEKIEEDGVAPLLTDKGEEKEELEKEKEDHESWDRQDDAVDGLTRLEESGEEEYMEKWRPRRKSREPVSYVRSETYEDEEEEEEEEEEDDLEEEERPTEWSWVRDPRSRIAAEDDGLLEHRRSHSNQRESFIEYDQREEDRRRDRRSQSRQGDRVATESPRSSLKRERSTSRASEARVRYTEDDDLSSGKRVTRHESRGSSASRDQDRATTPSWAPSRRERSLSRTSESRPPSRTSLTGREPDRTASWETSRHERSPSRAPMTPRREVSRQPSSESEEELSQAPRAPVKTSRKPVTVEPKVSDEEDWEAELRIRRKMLMERLASEDRDLRLDEGNDGWNSIKRRSSAEGKIALLKEPTGSNVMDSWTVSRGPRVSLLGSSQETEDDISGSQSQRDFGLLQREESLKEDDRSDEGSSIDQSRRRSYTSGSQVTSLEEEEDIATNDFVLNKDSKRITIMDLSKLSHQEESPSGVVSEVVLTEEQEEEGHRPIMATLKLFKRESIVKSQASEEDPEYLLPERPKLQEQDQDHPFKKAWQLQKSRSEEDPMPYALKEVKIAPESSRNRTTIKENRDNKESEESEPAESSSGPQSIFTECHLHDNDLNKSFDLDDPSSTSKSISEASSKVEWPSEDEQFNSYKLRKKHLPDEGNGEWELEET